MVQTGDIVTIPQRADGVRWVVNSFMGSPQGSPLMARLVTGRQGLSQGHTVSAAALAVVATPDFPAGRRVRVNGRAGTVVGEAQERRVRVLLDPFNPPLKSGGFIRRENVEVTPSRAQIAFENDL